MLDPSSAPRTSTFPAANLLEGVLLNDLGRPEAYGLAPTEPVSLRTTHASWVFVTPDDVWKLKRPINLGFLDYSTVEARRHMCEEEVRLNRRLAPEVYLGVEPVRLGLGGHTLVGDGPIVDWAVHMRRLPDEASAAGLLARGALDARALSLVATHLADFLGRARPTPAFGAATVLARNVEENFAQVDPFVGDLLDRRTLEEVRAFQTGVLSREGPRFAARVASGRIREGHGDLRLEHVYLLAGGDGDAATPRPAIIDCIEFNERFRCGDTAAEIAFLAMELEAARRPDLAAGLVARFAEASDDFDLYGVLDFYLSYRAWVRGKVAAFLAADLAGDPAAPAELRRRARDEAGRRFALARAFAGPPVDRPFMIAVGGTIGSGKSTLAEALGQALAVPVIGSDRTRKLTAGLAPTDPGHPGLYTESERERTYAAIVDRARAVLAAGRGVILDATFSARRWRQIAAATARAAGVGFAFIEVRCPRCDVLHRRLAVRRQERGRSVSDADDRLLDTFLRDYEPVGPFDPGPRLAIDTSGAPDTARADALARLNLLGIFPAAERRAS